MGPVAGVDLASKIISQTLAASDQEHLPMVLCSFPDEIGDRTEYILRRQEEAGTDSPYRQERSGGGNGSPDRDPNPGSAIARILLKMEQAGVTVAGLACNSAHAPVIFDRIAHELNENRSRIGLLHMIREVGWFLTYEFTGIRKVGIAGTTGTRASGLYKLLEEFGMEVLDTTDGEQQVLHSAIYHPEYGIKAAPDGASGRAAEILTDPCRSLKQRGAQAIVFGCTEFPLAYREPVLEGLPVIDTNLVLARALVRACDPGRLRPFERGSS